MLTATYDGKTVTLYKDGNQIAVAPRTLSADLATVGHGASSIPGSAAGNSKAKSAISRSGRRPLPPAVAALQQAGPSN